MEKVPGDVEPKVVLVVGGVCKNQDFPFYFEGNREPLRGFEQRRTEFTQTHSYFFSMFFYCDTSHII